jgi:hypothetical protein
MVSRALALAMALAFALAVVQCSQQTQQRGDPEDLADCVRSFCGCWTDVTFAYEATVVDGRGRPVAGAELACMGEDNLMARSNATGLVAFAIETQESPGCGLARCENLVFGDSAGRSAEVTAGATNGDTVMLRLATGRPR